MAENPFRVPSLITLAIVLSLTGCDLVRSRQSAHLHCGAYLHGEWTRLPHAPASALELLRSDAYEGGTVESQLRVETPFQDAWFSKGDTGLLVCRYRPVRDTCRDQSAAVEFSRANQDWQAGRTDRRLCHVAL